MPLSQSLAVISGDGELLDDDDSGKKKKSKKSDQAATEVRMKVLNSLTTLAQAD